MQNLQDLDVSCADSMELEQTIHQQKFITYADLAIQEPYHPAFHFVPGIIGLVIPQFTRLEKKHFLATGAILKKIY